MITINYIYEAIKQIIPNNLTTKFSFIDLGKVIDEKAVITENTVAIYLKSATNPERVIEGDYAIEYIRVVFNVYTTRGSKGVKEGLEYCKEVCETMDKVFNRVFSIDDKCFTILDSSRLGNYEYLGPTKQGIQTFSINYMLKYEGGN